MVQVFNFDNSTGILTNPITIYDPAFDGPYGLSFSPDNHLLYFDCEITGILYQYDLTSNNQITINASQYVVASASEDDYMALQIGIDGKIYVTRYGQSYLAAIANPNVIGVGCSFVANAVSLGTGTSEIGLPNFVDAYIAPPPPSSVTIDTTVCYSPINLFATGTGSSYQWSTGDTTQSISVDTNGTFWVNVIGANACNVLINITDTFHVTITSPLVVNLGPDTSMCGNGPFTIDAGNPGNT